MNPKGTPENLFPAHPGNTNAVKAGAFSPRLLAARSDEIRKLLRASYPGDVAHQVLEWEVANLVALSEKLDEDISARRVTSRSGEIRNVVVVRLRASVRLQAALNAYVASKVSIGFPLCEMEPGTSLESIFLAPKRRTPE
jgi:hypothetical protein